MFKTGGDFIDFYAALAIFFPLLPVLAIFIRNDAKGKESHIFLLIFCLLMVFQQFAMLKAELHLISASSISNLLFLPEMVFLAMTCYADLPGRIRSLVSGFIVSWILLLMTCYLLLGIDSHQSAIVLIKIAGILFLYITIVRNQKGLETGYIIFAPAFWIAAGTLFYYCMETILYFSSPVDLSNRSTDMPADYSALLYSASFIQYIMYLAGVLLSGRKKQDEDL